MSRGKAASERENIITEAKSADVPAKVVSISRGNGSEQTAAEAEPHFLTINKRTTETVVEAGSEVQTTRTEPLVRISLKDGHLEYGPNYRPDEAARIFWESIEFQGKRWVHAMVPGISTEGN